MSGNGSEKPGFQIGLAMAGAVSAGAYSAGVFDFLIEALNDGVSARKRFRPTSPILGIQVGAWLCFKPGVEPKSASVLTRPGWWIASCWAT